MLDYYVLKSIGAELVIFISLLLSGAVYAFYFYNKKAVAAMVIYLFLAGSILYVNSVDYAFNNIIQPHQKDRVNILLGLKSDPHGTGYNVNQSIISIGSGGFLGKGFLEGHPDKVQVCPQAEFRFYLLHCG